VRPNNGGVHGPTSENLRGGRDPRWPYLWKSRGGGGSGPPDTHTPLDPFHVFILYDSIVKKFKVFVTIVTITSSDFVLLKIFFMREQMYTDFAKTKKRKKGPHKFWNSEVVYKLWWQYLHYRFQKKVNNWKCVHIVTFNLGVLWHKDEAITCTHCHVIEIKYLFCPFFCFQFNICVLLYNLLLYPIPLAENTISFKKKSNRRCLLENRVNND
jgi:hypothetical protein